MRILGIDYGEKRIGLAVSDESQTLAREIGILSPKEFWKEFLVLLEQYEVGTIVVGYPLGMSGQETTKTREVANFQRQLREYCDVPIMRMDERLSTSMAKKLPGGHGLVDSLAAQIILQNYLDSKKAELAS